VSALGLFKLDSLAALVAGANSGIGKAMALVLSRAGALTHHMVAHCAVFHRLRHFLKSLPTTLKGATGATRHATQA